MDKLVGTSDMKKIQDLKGNPLLLFVNSWSVGMTGVSLIWIMMWKTSRILQKACRKS